MTGGVEEEGEAEPRLYSANQITQSLLAANKIASLECD